MLQYVDSRHMVSVYPTLDEPPRPTHSSFV